MEKKKRRINIVDVFIVIAAAVLIAAFAYFAVGDSGINTDTLGEATIRYNISIEGFAEEFRDLVKVGDKIRNVDFDCDVGEVVAVTPAEHTVVYNYNKAEQKMVPAQVPDSYKCTVTVETKCEEADQAYYVGAVQIKTGKKMNFRTPGFAFAGVVMEIERSVAQ